MGCTATGTTFLSFQTIKIMIMGVVAFSFGTAGGVLLAKFMNLFLKEKINPLIGSAGVSAVPMAAARSAAMTSSWLSMSSSCRAISSTAMKPALWRVRAYSLPGLPRPTINRIPCSVMTFNA